MIIDRTCYFVTVLNFNIVPESVTFYVPLHHRRNELINGYMAYISIDLFNHSQTPADIFLMMSIHQLTALVRRHRLQ